MGMNVSTDGGDEMNSTINTTPLVDVMLVLLIIFLIAVPVVLKTVPITLPKVKNIVTQSQQKDIVIAVNSEGDVFWNNVKVSGKEELLAKLRAAGPLKPQPEVHIRGDQVARYESVGRVVALCQKAGIVKVAFITDPAND